MKRFSEQPEADRRRIQSAFSLLEVMIAIGLFFMVAFTVLGVVSQCLRQAGALQHLRSPVGSLAAQTVLTNQLEEGIESGDFDDIFPDHRWTREVIEAGTNGLYEVNLTVTRAGRSKPDGELTLYLFRPVGNVGRPGRPGRPGLPGRPGRPMGGPGR